MTTTDNTFHLFTGRILSRAQQRIHYAAHEGDCNKGPVSYVPARLQQMKNEKVCSECVNGRTTRPHSASSHMLLYMLTEMQAISPPDGAYLMLVLVLSSTGFPAFWGRGPLSQ